MMVDRGEIVTQYSRLHCILKGVRKIAWRAAEVLGCNDHIQPGNLDKLSGKVKSTFYARRLA